MTWIKTVSVDEDEKVRSAVEAQRELYPVEYSIPIHPTADGQASQIVASHSLIPDALHHAAPGPVLDHSILEKRETFVRCAVLESAHSSSGNFGS